jgi:WhiB family transcriptional regulator, redox-sensing transcriptional regulator
MHDVDLPLPVAQDVDWMDDAACVGHGELFFPGPGGAYVIAVNQAKAICDDCPVIESCREYALNDASLEGIWAGMTDRERKRERENTQRGVLVRCRHCRCTFHGRNNKVNRCDDCAAAGHRNHSDCGACNHHDEDWYTALLNSNLAKKWW